MEGGVRGGLRQGTYPSSGDSGIPGKLFERGDRGVRWAGRGVSVSVVVSMLLRRRGDPPAELLADADDSAYRTVEGAGERSAKGSSSRRSDGGEFLGVDLRERAKEDEG